MTRYPTPTEASFYWAKWRIATEETCEGKELTPSDEWEVVQVNVNDPSGSIGEPEYFSVSVPGVREVQWPDCFVWGPKVEGKPK